MCVCIQYFNPTSEMNLNRISVLPRIDLSRVSEPPPVTSPSLPRSRSEPCLNVAIRQEFIRYRSLRETKKEKNERNNEKGKGKCNGWPIRIDVVSIVSGDQTERSEQEQIMNANANGQISNGLFANRNRSVSYDLL